MGSARQKPKRLAEKLRQIRQGLGLSQSEMLKRLELEEEMEYKRISEFELGIREPTLITLLRYAKIAGVNLEALADDELDLPDKLPSPVKHEGVKRKHTSRAGGRRR